MTDNPREGAAPEALILDFLQFLAAGPRPYAEVMDAWRTSCPRLTVWEEALAHGLVARRFEDGQALVALSPRGAERLAGLKLPRPAS